jgi:predicted ribosome quality control (RQC) complex YloA/Tae2 family protein
MFDVLTTAALVDELTRTIENGRIQQVGLISRQAIWLELFANRRRRYLVASAENPTPAVYLTNSEPVGDRSLVTPLLLLLRKYARGGRIVAIQQPPLERVISLTIAASRLHKPDLVQDEPQAHQEMFETESDDEDGEDAVFVQLHFEIMGRHSNLILVDDDGLIMESAKRVTPAMSRVRPISPKRPYSPPPVRDAQDPRFATEARTHAAITGISDRSRLIKAMPGLFRGISPQTAAEAIFRATGGSEGVPEPAALAQATRHLFEPLITGSWQPRVYRDAEGTCAAYSAQPIQHLQAEYLEARIESISEAIEACEGVASEGIGTGKHAVRSQRLAQSIQSTIDRLAARLDRLASEEKRHQDRDVYREWAELIYGYLWQIKPGDRELSVGETRVPLDPDLDPREQARRYIDQYQSAKSADIQIGPVRQVTEAEIAYLSQLKTLAEQAVSFQDIEDIEAEWRVHQPGASSERAAKRSSGRKRTVPLAEVKGQPIFVGRSGAENDRVTFEIAGPDDTWLHARGVPGSHVIVRWTGQERNDYAVLLRAAELAAYFSQSRQSNRVEVDITERRHVRKIKGTGPGMVTYRNERTVLVAPVGPE